MPNGNPTEAARRRAYNRRNDFLLCLCENVIENDFGNRIWLSCVSWWMASISISTRQQNMTGGRIKRKTNKQEISYFFFFLWKRIRESIRKKKRVEKKANIFYRLTSRSIYIYGDDFDISRRFSRFRFIVSTFRDRF